MKAEVLELLKLAEAADQSEVPYGVRLRDDIAPKVAADESFQNAQKNTPAAARMEHDKALARVMLDLLKDDTEVYKQFVQNESFKRFVSDVVYGLSAR